METDNTINYRYWLFNFSVNDVTMDSEESFYFTNYAYYKTPFYHLLELIIPLRFGNLMYYDGNKFRKQDEGFVTPNGVVLTPDKK